MLAVFTAAVLNQYTTRKCCKEYCTRPGHKSLTACVVLRFALGNLVYLTQKTSKVWFIVTIAKSSLIHAYPKTAAWSGVFPVELLHSRRSLSSNSKRKLTTFMEPLLAARLRLRPLRSAVDACANNMLIKVWGLCLPLNLIVFRKTGKSLGLLESFLPTSVMHIWKICFALFLCSAIKNY